jgi:hypothetical protein
MSATILNTDATINAKTVLIAEGAATVTGLQTFDRDPNPPFAVSSGSAVVPNLDADKLDGIEGAALYKLDGTTTLTAGIPFPAVQVPSAGVNVLDDYEEGTWTPTIISSGGRNSHLYITGWSLCQSRAIRLCNRHNSPRYQRHPRSWSDWSIALHDGKCYPPDCQRCLL